MSRQTIHSPAAPAAIGPYSQAVAVGQMVFLSGQIPLDPLSGQLVEGGIEVQARQAFANLQAVCEAAGGQLADCVKLTLFLTDLQDFATVNQTMQAFLKRHTRRVQPFRSRHCPVAQALRLRPS